MLPSEMFHQKIQYHQKKRDPCPLTGYHQPEAVESFRTESVEENKQLAVGLKKPLNHSIPFLPAEENRNSQEVPAVLHFAVLQVHVRLQPISRVSDPTLIARVPSPLLHLPFS